MVPGIIVYFVRTLPGTWYEGTDTDSSGAACKGITNKAAAPYKVKVLKIGRHDRTIASHHGLNKASTRYNAVKYRCTAAAVYPYRPHSPLLRTAVSTADVPGSRFGHSRNATNCHQASRKDRSFWVRQGLFALLAFINHYHVPGTAVRVVASGHVRALSEVIGQSRSQIAGSRFPASTIPSQVNMYILDCEHDVNHHQFTSGYVH